MRRHNSTVVYFVLTVVAFLSLRHTLHVLKSPPSSLHPKGGGAEGRAPHDERRDSDPRGTAPVHPAGGELDIEQVYRLISHQRAQSCPRIVRPKADDVVRLRNGHWHVTADGEDEIVVTSAFYDDRPMGGFLPHIRLLGVARGSTGGLHCHIWYPDHVSPYVTPALVNSTGRGHTLRGRGHYGQHQYSCRLPVALPLPSHVSIATDACRNSSMLLPVNVPARAHWVHEFGVCVAIAFGKIPVERFVEWVELHRILGVGEINIYDGNVDPSMADILDHYVDQGLLRVHPMPPPVNEYSKDGIKLASPASINDCLLRYMYRYNYAVIVDFDEVIIPRQGGNYSTLLATINQREKLDEQWLSYTFRNTYFFDHEAEDTQQPAYLNTMRRRRHAAPSQYLFAPKSWINPRQCFSAFNHYCWIKFPNSPKRWTVDVPPDVARSHHYRQCNFDKDKCSALSRNADSDDVILQYKDQLDSRVVPVLKKFKAL